MHVSISMSCRNWRRHLKSVRDPNDQLQIYQTLHLLLEEEDCERFQGMIDSFVTLWEEKEPKFINYFRDHYANRTGGVKICVNLW